MGGDWQATLAFDLMALASVGLHTGAPASHMNKDAVQRTVW